MSLRILVGAVVVAALFAAGIGTGIGSARWLDAEADATALTAALNVRSEVPRPTGTRPTAGGTFSAGLTRRGTGGRLAWKLTFRGLTGQAVAAHVHIAKQGKAGPVAAPLCGPCRSGARGTVNVNARTVKALMAGGAYVNVHTAKNPAGEIRGQVRKGGKPVSPPPGTTTGTTTTTTTYTDTYDYP
jgi:CHRD domain